MVFRNMEEQSTYTLRNQEMEKMSFGEEELEDFLEDMLVTPDQFVVLTAPKAQNQQIRYVQARVHEEEEEIEVELGIEEADGTHLYHKMCGEEECVQVFLDFFHNGLTVNLKAYQPVAF